MLGHYCALEYESVEVRHDVDIRIRAIQPKLLIALAEYPMTSITAMEGIHGQPSNRTDRLHRGLTTLLAFLMQRCGQLVNQAVLILALLIFNSGSSTAYGEAATHYRF